MSNYFWFLEIYSRNMQKLQYYLPIKIYGGLPIDLPLKHGPIFPLHHL